MSTPLKIKNSGTHLSINVNLNKSLLALGAMSGITAWLYSFFLERNWLEVTRHKLEVEGLDETWRGFRFAWLSDMHLGYKHSLDPVAAAFDRVIAEKPDLILLGGDFLDRGRWKPFCDELFRRLTSGGIPVLGIWGNHDYYGHRFDPERNEARLKSLGIRLLINDVYRLEKDGKTLFIAGLDDSVKGVPDIPAITRQLPPREKPLLLLCHNPNYTRKIPDNFCELILAGHTHGGQINPAPYPLHRELNWVRFAFFRHQHFSRYPQGWYNIRGNRLYVGRGIGVTGKPVRLGARPELAIFELQPV